jgi:gamma-glutamyltranspeptidase/glutathione hydrolase
MRYKAAMNTRFAFVVFGALALACGSQPAPEATAPAPAARPAASASSALPVASALFPSTWPYPSHASEAPSAHGAVTSDCALATEAGVAMLKSGGNAVDAAVTMALVLAVAYPTAGNLGGGGFAVVHFAGDDRALDFRETAPAAATRDMYAAAPVVTNAAKNPANVKPRDASTNAAKDAGAPTPFSPPPSNDGGTSRFGWRSSGTPGSVAGLYALHAAKGSKTWKEVVLPALAMARDGFVVDAAFVETIESHKKRLAIDPPSRALFLPNGEPPAIGSLWKNPDLARVLERISDQGPKGFYEGPTAQAIAQGMKAHGGLITLADLHAYQAKWRTPLTFTYRGAHMVAMPPPSSGGVTLAMIAHILEGYDLPHESFHSPRELHLLIEAMRRAFAARNARLGDPDFVENPLAELLSPAWADAQRKTIEPDHATPSSAIASVGTASGNGPHTTNLSVIDQNGNAVALTTTLNWFFGNGITVAGTGMVLNNEMDDFASVPGTANGFGLVQGEPNAIAPNKRMLSSMSPVVVLNVDGSTRLVAGAAGGPRIITSVLEVLLGVLDHDLDPVGALDAPRFHMQHLPDVVLFEKNGLDPALRTPLEAMGYTFKEAEHLADANAIGRTREGLLPAAEPRRKGSLALGY